MAGYVIGGIVIVGFAVLAGWGERIQRWVEDRRLSRHTCHTTCTESRWCKCGCRDGLFGMLTGLCCAVCGTQYVSDSEEYEGPWSWLDPAKYGQQGREDGGDDEEWGPYSSEPARQTSEITQENPAPKGFTSWGWERDREFRRAYRKDDEGE